MEQWKNSVRNASAQNASISLFASGLVKHARHCKGMSAFVWMNADVNRLKCSGRRMKQMGMMKELKTTQDIVKAVLEEHPIARNSDNHLCYWVYKIVGRKHDIDIDYMSIPRFFLHMKEFGFPSTETIRRTRQKIQAEHPELCGSSTVEGQRLLNEEVFRDYARGF